MGIRGKRNGAEPIIEGSIRGKNKNNAHRELCLLAGKWLRRNRFRPPTCHYVAVELVTANQETPDVFGWNYWTSVLIEVKVSRSDFLADKKKPFRLFPEDGLGEYRYYCCPKGLINPEEVPLHWGADLRRRWGYQNNKGSRKATCKLSCRNDNLYFNNEKRGHKV